MIARFLILLALMLLLPGCPEEQEPAKQVEAVQEEAPTEEDTNTIDQEWARQVMEQFGYDSTGRKVK